jgi:GT2 family glycosyltransferase
LPELSIVIPVYNNWWLTARCLRELDRLRAASLSFETIVVDNASRDETPKAIAAFPWVRYHRHESNRNFAGACNAGARAAEAPLTFFLNNDAYPLGDALTPLARAFDRPEVAIAGGALFFEDGVTQAAGLVMLRNAHWHYFFRNLPATLEAVERTRDALGVSGAAMAVRTGWFLENGGFDESFVNGFEDVDLCMRAREQERAIAYVAPARFAHYEAASAGRFDREAQNERLFYQRWSTSLTPLPRTLRGEVGAIALRDSCADGSLLAAARDDLEQALLGFGHPIVRGEIALWRRLDRRFRRAANLGWFSDNVPAPGIAIQRKDNATTIRTRGASTLEVPWLPCASEQRVVGLKLRYSGDPSCTTIGVAGGDERGLAELAAMDYQTLRIGAETLFSTENSDVACVVHLGLTDESGFGNVLVAQAGIPVIVPEKTEPRTLFADDVARVCERDAISVAVAQLLADPALRASYGKLAAADARRRFSPRRSAIRVVDLLCASRFGLERAQAVAP